MRLAGALLFVASVAAAEPEARSQPANVADSSLSFQWTAPPARPARAEVLARAERLIGHSVTKVPGAQAIVLVATVRALPNATWLLEVASDLGRESQRSVTANSCDELGDAMALLLALSIDPDYP